MLELGDIDLAESLEIQKRRGVRMLELLDQGSQVKESESPFSSKNMEGSQNLRVKVKDSEKHDIQNIGSGTRCMACGLLHFCLTPKCASCGAPMAFNLGDHHTVRRVA